LKLPLSGGAKQYGNCKSRKIRDHSSSVPLNTLLTGRSAFCAPFLPNVLARAKTGFFVPPGSLGSRAFGFPGRLGSRGIFSRTGRGQTTFLFLRSNTLYIR
jgi:hypothetical protein